MKPHVTFRKSRSFSLAFLLIVVVGVAVAGFVGGVSYQSSTTQNQSLPPVSSTTNNPHLIANTIIYSTYLNISLSLSNQAIAPASGTLKVQLNSATPWSDSRTYTINPGGWQSWVFYPTIPISSADSLTVTT